LLQRLHKFRAARAGTSAAIRAFGSEAEQQEQLSCRSP
jgi:hypothetical protein